MAVTKTMENSTVMTTSADILRTYTELSKLKTFKERYQYLRLSGQVGIDTFGFDRILNQTFYRSDAWRRIRRDVIVRDKGCDMGLDGYEICPADISWEKRYRGRREIIVHHMNPITQKDILMHSADILNPEYLITVSLMTHNAIHYGTEDSLMFIDPVVERKPNDTIEWRKL